MSAHTPGKWTVRHADDQEYPYPARLILGERGLLVAVARAAGGPDKNAAANARRIVAAVNAAEGISTETLESQGYAASYIATMAERDALKALNAELTEALRSITSGIADHLKAGTVRCDSCASEVENARAVLAKVSK